MMPSLSLPIRPSEKGAQYARPPGRQSDDLPEQVELAAVPVESGGLPRRIDIVRIPLSRETIELPWESREALLAQFAHLDSMRSTHKAFTDVGTSEPVRLTREQKADVLRVINFWSEQVEGGLPALADGIFDLRNTLADDLHDT